MGKDFRLAGLPNDAVMLKAGKPLLGINKLKLLGINNTVYSEYETPITIEGPRWVRDFAPALGLGNYVLLELPLPGPLPEPEESLQRFINAIKSLKRAREAIYETLSIGPPLTALRNALIEACYALEPLKLATRSQNGGCMLVKEKLKELFQGNELLAKLVTEVFTNVKTISTRGPEPTQPHLAPGPALTLYQVESLIGLATFILKLLLDTLKYRRI
ncbi:hypothetical protein [Pyrodictium occultum]|uniref:hypothetical protein n=1 Tax=Pyrodictium occultum TaxID=2309 RepID=UPI0014430D6F|nr:hypothetical protein [Pyrodictium occultum]